MGLKDEKKESRWKKVALWLGAFPRRHPLASLVLLSLIAIVVWITLPSEENADTSTSPDPIAEATAEQNRKRSVVLDSSASYREKEAYREYEQKMNALEEEKGIELERHFDGSVESRKEAQDYVESLGALYNLPYNGNSLRARYMRVKDSADGAKYIIFMGYIKSQRQASREWQRFLKAFGDSGDRYILNWQALGE